MKPVMASTILRDSSASFARNNSIFAGNSFRLLRDESPASSRSRSPSTKRKSDDNSQSYANAAKKAFRDRVQAARSAAAKNTNIVITPPPAPQLINAENLEKLNYNTAKLASICDKLHSTILALPKENPVCPILRDFCEMFHIHNENSRIFAESIAQANKLSAEANARQHPYMQPSAGENVSESDMESDSESNGMISLGRLPRSRNLLQPPRLLTSEKSNNFRPANNHAVGGAFSRSENRNIRVNSPTPEVDPALEKFREIVQDAEKSTVVFNLDMGRVPLINRSTMGIKATSALTAMAAAVEGRPANNPSTDTVTAIDDVLSVAEKVSFFGKSTKSLKGKNPNSGAFCTIPVCYTFPDRETRFNAEQTIRTRCKASCSTPYPAALRECIKLAMVAGKRARPDEFVRVNVDLPKLSLKMSWRARNQNTWSRHDKHIPIPTLVIQSPSRVPEGLELENLPDPAVRSVVDPLAERPAEQTGP